MQASPKQYNISIYNCKITLKWDKVEKSASNNINTTQYLV